MAEIQEGSKVARRDWITCPDCKRLVETYRETTGRGVMLGHRTRWPHDPGTPWCAGSGREVKL